MIVRRPLIVWMMCCGIGAAAFRPMMRHQSVIRRRRRRPYTLQPPTAAYLNDHHSTVDDAGDSSAYLPQLVKKKKRTSVMLGNNSRLWSRAAVLRPFTVDTLSAAGLSSSSNQSHVPCCLAAGIGFMGHSGLLILSTILVKMVYAIVGNKEANTPDDNEPQQAGIMNRCPWPFIFFHDPMQGLKDSPTWMVVVWIVLWRLVKLRSGGAAAALA